MPAACVNQKTILHANMHAGKKSRFLVNRKDPRMKFLHPSKQLGADSVQCNHCMLVRRSGSGCQHRQLSASVRTIGTSPKFFLVWWRKKELQCSNFKKGIQTHGNIWTKRSTRALENEHAKMFQVTIALKCSHTKTQPWCTTQNVRPKRHELKARIKCTRCAAVTEWNPLHCSMQLSLLSFTL